jgi:hypothetical protein
VQLRLYDKPGKRQDAEAIAILNTPLSLSGAFSRDFETEGKETVGAPCQTRKHLYNVLVPGSRDGFVEGLKHEFHS